MGLNGQGSYAILVDGKQVGTDSISAPLVGLISFGNAPLIGLIVILILAGIWFFTRTNIPKERLIKETSAFKATNA
jgi:hypothetical protein